MRKLLSLSAVALLAGLALGGVEAPEATAHEEAAAIEPVASHAVSGGGVDPFGELTQCLNEPTVPADAPPSVPADSILTEQPEVNCFAWQEFIALNWRASPTEAGEPDPNAGGDTFGEPVPEPVVWGTYQNVEQLFPPDGRVPAPWGTRQPLPPECRRAIGSETLPEGVETALVMTAKFSANLGDRQVLDEVNEAGVTPPAFLVAQNRQLVHYEVRVNQDFFNYVADPANRFYDARYQYAAVQPGGQGIDLPNGSGPHGDTGAIEIKAGWLEIPADQRHRFLTADAILITEGEDPPCRRALVGLVQLHIIHKTLSMPNWTWATFEHVEAAPDRAEVEQGKLHPPYLFYDPDCQPPTAPECVPNRKPETGDPMDRPIQVVRQVPIPDYVRALNERVHQTIEKANPDSVFQYYRLINTLWPQSGEGFSVGGIIPLSQGAAAPTTGLSNVLAETYAQNLTCLDCHQFAPIACSSATGPDPQYAADYSFQLSRASEPHPPAFCRGEAD
jgi:hypothetical protein